jgi:hypothetical protein
MILEFAIDGATARMHLTDADAGPTRRLLEVLPLEDVAFVPSIWSGPVCEVDLSGTGYDFGEASVFSLGCSIYPGMVMLRRDRNALEISYGPAESRSAAGVEYGLAIGRLGPDGRELMARLASSHQVGELRGSIRQLEGTPS